MPSTSPAIRSGTTGVAEVARRFRPRLVVLFAGAARTRGAFHLTMDANDAIETAHAFPHARIVAAHTDGWAHFTESGEQLAAAFAALGLPIGFSTSRPQHPCASRCEAGRFETAMTDIRKETDSLGEVEVPADRLWGAQTQRSLKHFSIGRDLIPREMIAAYAILKKAAAEVNHADKRLGDTQHRLIVQASTRSSPGSIKICSRCKSG